MQVKKRVILTFLALIAGSPTLECGGKKDQNLDTTAIAEKNLKDSKEHLKEAIQNLQTFQEKHPSSEQKSSPEYKELRKALHKSKKKFRQSFSEASSEALYLESQSQSTDDGRALSLQNTLSLSRVLLKNSSLNRSAAASRTISDLGTHRSRGKKLKTRSSSSPFMLTSGALTTAESISHVLTTSSLHRPQQHPHAPREVSFQHVDPISTDALRVQSPGVSKEIYAKTPSCIQQPKQTPNRSSDSESHHSCNQDPAYRPIKEKIALFRTLSRANMRSIPDEF